MKPLNRFFVIVYYLVGLVTNILHPASIEGLENLPPHGALLCPNHSSNWDPVILVLKLPIDWFFSLFSGYFGGTIFWPVSEIIGSLLWFLFGLLYLAISLSITGYTLWPRKSCLKTPCSAGCCERWGRFPWIGITMILTLSAPLCRPSKAATIC